ncbi:MAG: LemA family protein [Nanoarchaeota archaeon]|nr:LemA family protein [Nanoarchaeota archaeon]
MVTGLWILIVILVLVALVFTYYFNRLVILSQRIKNSLSQIDVQLKKRAELVPNLLESVKGYVKHEKAVMTSVTNARKALLGAGDIVNKMKAGNVLESALGRLFAIAENYPQLRANENFLQLQQELSAIEDKIAYARQHYNDSILSYNSTCTTFPGLFFAKMFGKKEQKYIEIPVAQKAVPKVKF